MTNLLLNSRDSIVAVLESSHNGILIADDNGIIVFLNSSAEKILDVRKKKLIGKPVSLISQKAYKEFKEIMVTGKPYLGKKIGAGDRATIANRTPIKDKDHKKIIGVLSIFQHISDIEKITSELSTYKQMAQQLDTIIESSYDGLYITDGQANTLRVNPAWEKITGLKAEDVIGKNVIDLKRKGLLPKITSETVINEKRPYSIKAKTITGNEVLITGKPVFDDDGNVIMVVANVRSLTDMQRLSRELDQSRKLTRNYRNKVEKLKAQLFEHENIISESKAMKDVLELSMRVAAVDAHVLITGETGVGKEVIAKFIHENSKRSNKGLLLQVNCGAIPENLLETELFGYEGGAFTGASRGGKPGLFETAAGGTILLDEIGELSLRLQVKLLKAVQDFEITRVGSVKPKRINVRLISCTHRDLGEMIKRGTFREDLYFRLNVVPIYIPPLRERRDDIFPLIKFSLQKYNLKYKKSVYFSQTVVDHLINYDWPGNIRELANLVERLVVITPHDEITMDDLPGDMQFAYSSTFIDNANSLKNVVCQFETTLMKKAVDKHGSVKDAAHYLKVNPTTIYRKLKNCK